MTKRLPPSLGQLELEHQRAKHSIRETMPAPEGAITFGSADAEAGQIDEYEKGDPALELTNKLPGPPFRMMIVGAMGSGKTSLLKHLITAEKTGYNGIFDKVRVWGPNMLTDPSWSFLFKPNKDGDTFPADRIHTKWNPEEVDLLVDECARDHNEDLAKGIPPSSAHRELWIIDDATAMKGAFDARGDASIVNTRHAGISLIIAGHRLNRFSTLVRSSQSMLFFYPGMSNDDEIFIDEMGASDGMPKKLLTQKLMQVARTKKPFNMVTFYPHAMPGEKIYQGLGGPHISNVK